jgi:hypothetical protein
MRVPARLQAAPLLVLAAAVVFAGCGGRTDSYDIASEEAGARSDARPSADGGHIVDSSPGPDAHPRDAGGADAQEEDAGGADSGLPDGACLSNADCPGDFMYCASPYSGGCVCEQIPACTVDSECDGGEVCRNGPDVVGCSLGDGMSDFCAPPCAGDDQCYYWQECTGGHCLALPCDRCPTYLSCGAAGCARKACTTPADCPGGLCVSGQCLGAPGTCTPGCA